MQTQVSNKSTGLRSNVLGFPEVLAQSIALISPTMTAVLIIPLTFSFAGQSTWLAYLFATVMLLFVVFNLNQFARRSASPGSMYVYTGRGLGAYGGVLSGWTLLWAYMFIGIAGMNGFAIFASQLLDAIGVHASVSPIVFFLLSSALCWFLAYKDIRLSAVSTLILEGISVAFILVLAAVILFAHGFTVDMSQVTLKGISLPGMSLGVIACIFSLVGFESATALGGEAKNPLRSIPRAVIWSLILTGLFFVLMSYVEVFGVHGYKTTLDQIGTPLNVLSDLFGISFFKIPLSIGAMISFFSLSLSCLNAGARIAYPMGLHGIFHTSVGQVHKDNKTPHVAITVYILIMALIPTIASFSMDTLTAFNDAGTFGAYGFLLAYFLISIAAPFYLYRDGRLKAGNVVVAVLAVLCLLVPTIGSFYPVPPFPLNLFPYIFLAYMVIGVVWIFVLSRRNPGMVEEIEADFEATLRQFDRPESEAVPVAGTEMVRK